MKWKVKKCSEERSRFHVQLDSYSQQKGTLTPEFCTTHQCFGIVHPNHMVMALLNEPDKNLHDIIGFCDGNDDILRYTITHIIDVIEVNWFGNYLLRYDFRWWCSGWIYCSFSLCVNWKIVSCLFLFGTLWHTNTQTKYCFRTIFQFS